VVIEDEKKNSGFVIEARHRFRKDLQGHIALELRVPGAVNLTRAFCT
jgi:hypothetical protein